MRRVLHLKLVTQCAMLEDFGIFLVLADKVRSIPFASDLSHIFLVVVVCISYRSSGTFISTNCACHADSAETQWHDGCSFLQCRLPWGTDTGNLYEEKRSKPLFILLETHFSDVILA